MKRVMLRVAYDGTAYMGWQLQSGGETIESVLNRTLSEFLGEQIEVIGASRTDSGVHAMDNVAVFDTESRMPADRMSYALNRRLPEDIRIRRSLEVPADFHPRHTDSIKTYEYHIWNDDFPNPVNRLYSHFVYVALDADKMAEAAGYVVGTHDFSSFCAAGSQAKSHVRTVTACGVERNGHEIVIRVSGTGFLYNMVRIIAGTLMEVGRGKYPPEQMKNIIEAKKRTAAGPTAPANGLMLLSYQFPALETLEKCEKNL